MVVRCRCLRTTARSDGNTSVTGSLPKTLTVLTCRTEILCVIGLTDAGDRQVGVGFRVAHNAKPGLETTLHLNVAVVNRPNQNHVASRPTDCPVLVPQHVGVVGVSMVTVEADISWILCRQDKMPRGLVDDKGGEDQL